VSVARRSATSHRDLRDAADPRDPYGVLESFGGVDAWLDDVGADTIAGALDQLERAPTTTDYDDRRRCPECYGVRWRPKRDDLTRGSQRREEDLRCVAGHHFEAPAPSPAERREALREELPTAATHADRLAAALPDDTPIAPSASRSSYASHPPALHGASDGRRSRDTPAKPDTTMSTQLPTPQQLRDARDARALTLREPHTAGVVAHGTLSKWERGRTSPRLDRLRALLAYYEVVDGVRDAERLAETVPDEVLGDADDDEGVSR
jgi:DNA-binding transcriptional regulator YiaG